MAASEFQLKAIEAGTAARRIGVDKRISRRRRREVAGDQADTGRWRKIREDRRGKTEQICGPVEGVSPAVSAVPLDFVVTVGERLGVNEDERGIGVVGIGSRQELLKVGDAVVVRVI